MGGNTYWSSNAAGADGGKTFAQVWGRGTENMALKREKYAIFSKQASTVYWSLWFVVWRVSVLMLRKEGLQVQPGYFYPISVAHY